jgi:S1-C subfamily serine protease
MHITDQLSYSTIRIECKTNAGYSSTGTGFFFNFCCENNTCRPAIVTNKHVIKDATECNLIFTLADSSGNPIDEKHWIANIIGLQSADLSE